MRKYYFLLLCFALPFFVAGQPYSNSWITYSQKYYKIKVAQDGIYRIDSAALAASGIPLSSIDPRNFQLFFRGQEQYIYVRGENDGKFNNGDYIEFYGRHNSGSLDNDLMSDSLIYTVGKPSPGIKAVPNPYYSLYNDTSTYFLTWNSSVTNHRMSVVYNTNFSSYTATPYFTAQAVTYGSSSYYEGTRLYVGGDALTDPRFSPSEGWFNNGMGMNGSQTFNPAVTNVYTAGPNAYVKTFFAGESTEGLNDHDLKITTSWGDIWDTTFTGFAPVVKTYSVAASQFSSPSLQFSSLNISGINTNITAVSYILCSYPHTPDLGGASNYMMYVSDGSLGYTYLNLTNLTISPSDSVHLYDLTNHVRMPVVQSGSNYNVLVPDAGNTKQCYINDDGKAYKITKLIPAGNNGTFTYYTASSSSLTHPPYIIIYHPSLSAEALAYASYRDIKYDAVAADIEQLYDQFGYGIEKDPLAIRNFCNYALNTWKVSPAYLFFIGKGIHSYLYRQDAGNYAATLIPSIGNPSSDILLTAGLKGTLLQPAIPTGRIAAVNGTEVDNYLDKVKTYESATPALWMKNMIHFCGGSDAYEQSQFNSFLNQYATIAEDTSFGANVYLIKKTTSDPIQITLADSVTQLINNGVSVMTFFGHASGNNFDQSLDAPSDYNNVGRYPLIIADACFSGDIFQPLGGAASSTSEQFVLDPKGSIGFIATDGIGEAGHLYNYTYRLYQDFCSLMYRKPIGNCQQETIKSVADSNTADQLTAITALEMTLHGDPAIALNGNDSLPDYSIADSNLSFSPSNVTTQVDSFKINLTIYNLGKAINAPVQVEIDRIYPNGTKAPYYKTVSNIYYKSNITLTLPVDKVKGVGINYITAEVDPGNIIKEITKTNNNIVNPGIKLWITAGDIIPVYPYNFAIIPKDTATLKACTGDPYASAHSYVFQIDTTDSFNTPFLKTQVVSNIKGAVVCASWKNWVNTPGSGGRPFVGSGTTTSSNLRPMGGGVQLLFKDSTVYYWRVRRDTLDTKDYTWHGSSFQYIKGKSGWGQSHYFQFRNNQYVYMSTDIAHRGWQFSSTGKRLKCQTFGVPYDSIKFNNVMFETGFYLDLTPEASNGCQFFPSLYMSIIDSTSLSPWIASDHPGFGVANTAGNPNSCKPNDPRFMYFCAAPTQLHSLLNVLQYDSIPNGDYILVYSWLEAMFRSWGADSTALKNQFIKLGANPAIRTAPDSVPWIFFVQKGHPSTAITLIGKNKLDSLSLVNNLLNHEYYGSMTTPLIGPAQKWDSISWRQHSLMKTARDSVRMTLSGLDINGNATTLLKGVPPAVANMYITSVNPKKYPYLQMMLYTKDTVTRIPSQMDKWQVFYTPVPEVAVNPSIYSSFYSSTLQAGDSISYKTVVQNIGDYTMDSMLVNWWVADQNNSLHYLPATHTKKLNPGDTTLVSIRTPASYAGNNSIWLEVNPEYLPQTLPEEYHFNNYAKQGFVVSGDKIKPLLDVTFDGVHILNNDIISPHPNILVEVTDDNKFLPLDNSDTGNITVYIRNINNPVAQRVYFGPQLQFTPAVLPDNKCKLLYTPSFADGTYELTVQAADRSGNISAANSYKIDFQVINKSSITEVLNYPNPFSTATRFVFTLTGDQLPTYFKIQIMTITGKVVREITENELGPLHIGRNITEYAWDGTDQFGDKLANGIYLYKVITSINNQAIDHMATNADQYFTKGWGKMYLIR